MGTGDGRAGAAYLPACSSPTSPLSGTGSSARNRATISTERAREPARSPASEEASGEPTSDELFEGLEGEAIADVALFIPFGLLFPLVVPRWRWWTVAAAVATSATIEAVQLLFLSWRSPSWADIALNSLGGVIGFGLWWAAARVLPRTMAR